MFVIRRCIRKEKAAVEALRRASYGDANEFSVADPAALDWCSSDDLGVVLGAWHEEVLVATMKGQILADPEHAQRAMECEYDDAATSYPALLLGKGATIKAKRAHGHNSVIRALFIEAASELCIKTILGIVFEDAPRTRLLQSLGYELLPTTKIWYTDLIPKSHTLIARLDQRFFSGAITKLKSNFDSTEYTVCIDVREDLANSLKEADRVPLI
ncbi:hypothetical protein [Microvirga massiliensis]|uniref:hypothetical protein n=1 Tax=Microvirga massiliensis TaxID=1033741 RepID=UPI00062B8F78|nr:hypothetical protein [Microvirga massiliensis]